MNRISCVLWDWNGTLLDDVSLCLRTVNRVLLSHRCTPLKDLDEYREKFCFPVEQYYRNIGFDFTKTPFPVLAKDYMDLYQPASSRCGLQPNAEEVIRALSRNGVTQAILSASETRNLKEQVERFPVLRCFSRILGIGDIYAQSKTGVALQWRKESGISPERILFVGDSLHDHETAQALGCRCILYSGGHQSAAVLSKAGCPVTDDLRTVLSFVLPQQSGPPAAVHKPGGRSDPSQLNSTKKPE